MGIFRQFPYSNFHELNLDRLIGIVIETKEKVDNFIIDTTDLIKNAVAEWIAAHPEYVTTVMDGAITRDKLNESLQNQMIFNDKEQIHKRQPVFINDTKYVPDDHMCNGFTGDDTYFYIAHHYPDDDTLLYITKVNREDGSSETYETSLTGHGNTLSVYKDYLYITDLRHNVDVINKNNPNLVIGRFAPDPYVNAFSIKEIGGKIVTCGCTSGNNVITVNEVRGNKSTLIERFIMDGISNAYVQGIDHTSHVVYVSYSYGQNLNDWYSSPFIDAYSWSGQLLNRVYIDIKPNTEDPRENEIEDIFRDSAGNIIYFVTSSGRIGYVRTVQFTTDQTAHDYGSGSFRLAQYRSLVLTNNDDPQVTYFDNTLLASRIRKASGTTIHQGYGIGVGILAGYNAIAFIRGDRITMFCNGRGSSVLQAQVNYSFDNSTEELVFVDGTVDILDTNTGLVSRRNIQTWSQENPNARTVINTFIMLPLTIPFASANPIIPIDED